MRRITPLWQSLMLTSLLGCALNTEPIAATGGAGGSGATLADMAVDAVSSLEVPACDVDLACTEDCPDDLDCVEGVGAFDRPSYEDLREANTDADHFSVTLDVGEDAWFALPEVLLRRTLNITADAPMVLAVYTPEGEFWPMVARNGNEPQLALTVEPQQLLVLRVHAIEALQDAQVQLSAE